MKKLFSHELGSDGVVAMVVEEGKLKLEVGYNLDAALKPVKTQIIDKIKAAIPGDYEDAILDKLFDAIVKALTE